MSASSYRAWGVALALAGVVSFSFRPILIKLAYAYVTDPVTLLALRMVFSLPFFVGAALWLQRDSAGERAPLTRRDLWTVLFLGFLQSKLGTDHVFRRCSLSQRLGSEKRGLSPISLRV